MIKINLYILFKLQLRNHIRAKKFNLLNYFPNKMKNNDNIQNRSKNNRQKNILKCLIIFGSFIVYFIADGVSLSFGIFTREFIEHFKSQETESFVFITTGLLQAIPLFLSPFVCFLIDRYQCRPVALAGSTILVTSFILTRFFVRNLVSLNIIIGLMTSCGLAMCYIPAYLIISFYFDKRRALATGIAVSGSGLGLFALSPLSEYLISEYGWMDTCFIFGAISSHTFISAVLFRPKENIKTKDSGIPANVGGETEVTKLGKIKKSFKEINLIFKSKKFLIVNLVYFILSFVIIAPHNFLPSHTKLNQIDDPNSFSISLIGISALIGQIVIGFISDTCRSLNWLLFSICIILSGLATIILPHLTSIYLIYLYSVLFGFTTSVNYVLQSSLVIESSGLSNLTLAFGCVQLSQGFSTLLGTPLLSLAKDFSKNYKLTFYISGVLMILTGLILFLWPIANKYDKIKTEKIELETNDNMEHNCDPVYYFPEKTEFN